MCNVKSRDQLYIFDHEPSVHEIYQLDGFDKGVNILTGYKETADAILQMQHIIYTTQMSFLQHFFIKFGYDIILCLEDGYTVTFDENDLIEFDDADQYYMLKLYNIGDLYKKI